MDTVYFTERKKFAFYLSILLLLGFLLRFTKFQGSTEVQAFILGAAFFLILSKIISVNRHRDKKWIIFLCLILLVIKFIAALLQTAYHPFPDEFGVYDRFGWLKTLQWYEGEKIDLKAISGAAPVTSYIYSLSAIYFIFGHNLLLGKLFNIGLSLFAGLFIYVSARVLFGRMTARTALFSFAFLPSMTFWTVPLTRDALSIFFITGVMMFFIKFAEKRMMNHYIAITLFFLGALAVRNYIGIILGISMLIAMVFYVFLKKKFPRRTLFVAFVIAAIVYIALSTHDRSFFEPLQLTPQKLAGVRVDSAQGSMAFYKDVKFSSWNDILSYLPKGIFYFLLAPFPFTLNGILNKAVSTVDVLLWYAILTAFVLSIPVLIKRAKTNVGIIALLSAIIGMMILFGAVEGNIGNIYRHRIQVEILVMVLAGSGMLKLKAFFTERFKKLRLKRLLESLVSK